MINKIRVLALYLRYRWKWRLGQSIFNATYRLFPSAAIEFQGTDLDPYFHDDRVDSFLSSIQSFGEKGK